MRTKSEPFTLCMLGTDTNYTPELKQEKKSSSQTAAVADYPKGETLSIISSLIKSNEVKIDLISSVPYKSDAVTVINGPDTLGRNVGEKIGLGLAEILLAIARGKQPINIIAHSRGAVESVLIAHELQTVRSIVTSCDSINALETALKAKQTTRHKSKPANNTPDIIQSLNKHLNVIPQQQHQQWFKSLQDNISATSVNFFGIDPVPGDALGITWYDERYFTLPAIVKNGQIFYYENERSDWGFTPAYIEAEDPTIQQLKHDSIPGHHGTGSAGNNASQQKVGHQGQTTHVQKLMIFKLLDFLNQNGVGFKALGESLFKKNSGLGAKHIKRNAGGNNAQSVEISWFDFPAIYRQLYQKIADNRAIYNRYNITHYKYMGVVEQRRLLKKGHEYGLFTDVFILLEGLINAEHGCLIREELCKVFGLKDDITDLSQFVKQIHANLATQLNTLVKLPSQKSTDLMSSGVMVLDSAEIERQKLEEKTQVEVINIFELAVKSVSSSYLKYDWSLADKQKEKKLLFAEIKELFKLFETLATPSNDDKDVKGFVAKLKMQSIAGIDAVIKQQYGDLNSNFSQLQQPKNSKIAQYFKSLALRSSTDISAEIDGILAHSDYQLIAEYPIKRKIAFIVAELRKSVTGKGLVQLIESDFAKNNPPREEQSLSLNNPLDISAELTHAFIEQHEQNFEQFARLYEQMDVFIKDIGGLMALLPEHKKIYDKYIEKLSDQLKQLVQMAASTFYEHHKLADVPAVVEGAFAVQVRKYAVEHYDGLAEQYQLGEEIQRLQGAIDALSSEKDKTQSEHQQQVEDLKTTNQSQITALDEKHKEMQDEIQKLQQGHELNAQQITDDAVVERNKLEQKYKQALDEEQKAYKEQQKEMQEENQQLQQQVKDLETANESQITKSGKKHEEMQDEIQKLQNQNQQLQQGHELNAQQITDDAVVERNKLEQKYKQALDEEQKAYKEQQKEMQEENQQLQQQVKDLKTANESQITKSGKKHEEMQDKIQKLQNQNQKLQQEHQKRVVALNTSAESQVSELHNKFTDEMQRLQQGHELIAQQITDDAVVERNKLEQQYKQALDKEQKAYNEQQNQCATEHTMLLALLHNKHEAECLLLIEYKLRPLTRHYLQHLQKSSYNSDIAMIKIGHVEDLLTALDDTVKTIKASERVDNFYLALDKAAGDLQQHRDPGWKLFVRNAVICGAILASGILPGLLFLATYTKITGNPYAFWSSQGAHYLSMVNGFSRPERNEADEALSI